MEEIALGDRLKMYEKEYENTIDSNKHIIVRIDGHKFSKYSKGFKKPFDTLLADSMIATTQKLVEEFQCSCGYTQSDEITLAFPSYKEEYDEKRQNTYTHIHNGRIQKMVSLIAAFTTMTFNKILSEKIRELQTTFDLTIPTIEMVQYLDVLKEKEFNAWFDARIFAVVSKEELFNAFLWRVRDAEKNSKSMAAYAYLPHKTLLKMTGEERVALLKATKGIDWETYEDKFKYGTFIKKQLIEKEIDGNVCMRGVYTQFSQKLTFSQDNVDLIYRKYL